MVDAHLGVLLSGVGGDLLEGEVGEACGGLLWSDCAALYLGEELQKSLLVHAGELPCSTAGREALDFSMATYAATAAWSDLFDRDVVASAAARQSSNSGRGVEGFAVEGADLDADVAVGGGDGDVVAVEAGAALAAGCGCRGCWFRGGGGARGRGCGPRR